MLIAIFLLLLSPLSATYIFFFEEENINEKQRIQLFDLVLRGEPPRAFYNTEPYDLKSESQKVISSLQLEWIPPSVWQIAALHAFFYDEEIRNGILACLRFGWDPLEYEQMLHMRLSSASNIEEIVECFDSGSQSLPGLCELFFKMNQAIVSLYKRADSSYAQMLHLAISELPPFNEWREKQFPFWRTPWIYNPNSVQIFYDALKDETLLAAIVEIEQTAQENGEWVLYRGYPGSDPLSTLQLGDNNSSHALSFGSTLLGGAFFSLEAAALTYSKPDVQMTHHFLALRVTPHELKEIFRVGPLHPFIQLLVNGEMFHAHTKIAAKDFDEYRFKALHGYFMESNRYCQDSIGYIVTFTMTSEELEKAFLALCEKSGHIFFTNK